MEIIPELGITAIRYDEWLRRRRAWRAASASGLNPINSTQRCMGCGDKLKPNFGYCHVIGHPKQGHFGYKHCNDFTALVGFGYNSNNWFCTKQCGMEYAVNELTFAEKKRIRKEQENLAAQSSVKEIAR